MADKEIVDLTDGVAPASGDLAHVVRGGNSRKVALGNAAGKDTGTASGTVAAGDDSRITGAIAASLLTTRGDMIRRGASAPERFAKGSPGQVLTMGADDPAWATPRAAPDIILEDRKASGTNGGTSTAGSYQTRDLNTEVRDVYGDCTLSSNQFTLPAGSYYIEFDAPGLLIDNHKAKIRNVTDSTDAIIGSGAFATSNTSAPGHSVSSGAGVVTIAGSKTFELQHRSSSTRSGNGFGGAVSFGDSEVFSRVRIWRTA